MLLNSTGSIAAAIEILKHEDEVRQPLVPEPQPDKATARPWQWTAQQTIIDSAGQQVADCASGCRALDCQERDANADLIVRAVNEHAALVACEKTLKDIKHNATVMNQSEPNRVWSAIEDAAGKTLVQLAAIRNHS